MKIKYHVPLIFWHSDLWGKNHTAKCQNLAKPEWAIFNAKMKDHERKLLVPDGKNFIVVK